MASNQQVLDAVALLAAQFAEIKSRIETIESAPAAPAAKSRTNSFVTEVIRSAGHKCVKCGKTFRTANRAIVGNHYEPKA